MSQPHVVKTDVYGRLLCSCFVFVICSYFCPHRYSLCVDCGFCFLQKSLDDTGQLRHNKKMWGLLEPWVLTSHHKLAFNSMRYQCQSGRWAVKTDNIHRLMATPNGRHRDCLHHPSKFLLALRNIFMSSSAEWRSKCVSRMGI